MQRTFAVSWLGRVRVGALAALLGLVATPVARVAALEPEPGNDRLSLEAFIAPEHVAAPDSPIQLCVRNVNPRSAPGQSLIPDDSWLFVLEAGCGSFVPAAACAAEISVDATRITASDLGCLVTADRVLLTYSGAPKPLVYGEGFCIGVRFAPGPSECGVEYRLAARPTVLGSFIEMGIGRVNQPPARAFFTLSPMSGGGGNGATGATGTPGQNGATGPMGPAGPAGPSGASGAAGAAGASGASGARGTSGTSGAAGPVGASGPAGSTGMLGPSGAAGASGASGPSGPNGASGGTGATGASGPRGSTGPAGTSGAVGPTGTVGSTGPVGTTGSIGSTGAIGNTGDDGPTGPVGATGVTGAVGTTGDTGSTGPVGPTGAVGATGSTGSTGSTGPSGPEGITGTTGVTGPSGPEGITGTAGITGPSGPSGASGSDGSTGATGPIGPTGSAGTTGETGPSGPSGALGASGTTGETGPSGASGTAGPRCMGVESPVNGDDYLFLRAAAALTVSRIDCLAHTASTSAVVTVSECDGNGQNCTDTIATGTCGDTNSALPVTAPAVSSGSWLRIAISAVSGFPGHMVTCVTFQ